MNFDFAIGRSEKRAIGLAACAVFILASYLWVWEPMVVEVEQLQEKIPKQQELLGWMEEKSNEVERLRATRSSSDAGEDRSLLVIVSETARQTELSAYVRQIQPDGDAKIRIWLEGVPFNMLVAWMEQLREQHDVAILDVSLSRTSVAGRVDGRLRLSNGG